MPNRFPVLFAIALWLGFMQAGQSADTRDYTKEPMVVQTMTTEVIFSQDGAREWRQTLAVRVQSEGVLRQLGVLSFPYGSANEEMTVDYVRVRKADGSVVATPQSSMVDTTAEIATSAPTYSDLRQKQIPVKALEVGDVLEYAVRSSQRKPEVPGQFWYQQVFLDNTVILNESLTVSMPKDTFVQVVSPKLKYETQEAAERRIYIWRRSQLEPSKTQDNKQATGENEAVRVRLTTFRNWEGVGSWWRTLAAPEATVTPAIQEKAKELTAGLSSNADKARAIYKYVSMKFRYISISFGEGRYRPHSAEDVLANQYGDCKDKHTLFAALLKAAGVEAWPALIGAGIKFDESVPAPDQFNHVISVLPEGGKYVWLDTTQEVAPFGLLSQGIRDEEALVIPTSGKPFLLKTPAEPPFRTSEIVDVKATLGEDGTLAGHFDLQVIGYSALELRSVFRQVAPVQWQELAQQISGSLDYGGDVSGVDIENLDDLDKPFHYAYNYKRTKYSAWEQAKITPPLPFAWFGPGDEAEKPKEPFWAGSPGEICFRASVQLPKGYFIEPPANVSLTSEFADYSAQYSFENGTFSTNRKMTVKKSKVGLDQWANYQKFAKGLRADQVQFFLVGKDDEKSATAEEARPPFLRHRTSQIEPAQLVEEARSTRRDYDKTIGLTEQANAIWKKNGTKPPEYGESLVMLSLAKLANAFAENGGSEDRAKVYAQWRAESADALAEAVEVGRANPDAKPAVLALAFELQALQANDKSAAKKLRDQSEQIRGKLMRAILPAPELSPPAGNTGDAPFSVGGDVQPPTLLQRIEPVYSEEAREARIEGTVRLAIVVEEDGTPSSVYLLEGLGFGLDEEAAKAVKQWRFKPGTRDGRAVRIQARIDVAFKLL